MVVPSDATFVGIAICLEVERGMNVMMLLLLVLDHAKKDNMVADTAGVSTISLVL